jgi:UTP-glucose-1-phosphate uridylyltransferase
MVAHIRRAVIPAAGLGSRLLPLTKATPKEMLPVGDKPVIEHTVRELVDSGITDITIVVSGSKYLIQEHFEPNPGLVSQLRAAGKDGYADAVEEVADLARRGHITYLFQHGPYGYVITPGIIDELREQTRRWYEHRQGEIYLTDAINAYAARRAVYGQVIEGTWYDTGSPLAYLTAQFAAALSHPEYGPSLRRLAASLGPVT